MDTLADAIAAALTADPRLRLENGPAGGRAWGSPAEVAGRIAARVAVEHLVGDVDTAVALLTGMRPDPDGRWSR